MTATLIRHTHPDHPTWEIINDTVPIGTTYEVLGFREGMHLSNAEFGEVIVDAWFVLRPGGGPPGWLPAFCLEVRGADA